MTISDYVKKRLRNNDFIASCFSAFLFYSRGCRVRGKTNGNRVSFSKAFLQGCKITFSKQANTLIVGKGSRLVNCVFFFGSSNGSVIIGENCDLQNVTFWLEDQNSKITVGDNTTVSGDTHLAAIEGKQIIVGCDCMFSSNVDVRTGDSHSVIDAENRRTNPSQDVVIGDHVWLCKNSSILKGCVGNNTIVGYRTVVINRFEEKNVALGGIPAKILKRGVNWDRKRLNC